MLLLIIPFFKSFYGGGGHAVHAVVKLVPFHILYSDTPTSDTYTVPGASVVQVKSSYILVAAQTDVALKYLVILLDG
jgi:hypothetical protein